MNVADQIRINARYTRSVNLERDRGSASIIDSYLPTTRGMDLLEDVLHALGPGHLPRAWSIIGPYGSGKSSFALYLHELLGAPEEARKVALNTLHANRRHLARGYAQQQPWCRAVVTGSEEPLPIRLLNALNDAASTHWARKTGRKPRVVNEIRLACEDGESNPARIVELVDDLHLAIQRSGAGGLAIIIDEMGRFLEYEARQGGGGLSVLQDLAERAFRGSNANLLLFVLLHQSFDLYARGLGEKLANDWAKIQGRFETVSFVEAPEQILKVIAAAFSNTLTIAQQRNIHKHATRMARQIGATNGLPSNLNVEEAADVFAACYPIHPIALLILPPLCQRFAQNERTLFTYLGSREPSGFSETLRSLGRVGDWIHPSTIYDYFIHNQPAVLADPLSHRRWIEVVTSVERAENVLPDNTRLAHALSSLAKTIGLLNLTFTSNGLKASPEILRNLFSTKKALADSIDFLLDASIIQFRRFSGEYRVWQGTDFDIDDRARLEADKLGRFNLAEVLRERADLPPVVTRRHSFRTGTLRYFDITFADHRSAKVTLDEHPGPRIIFFLAEDHKDDGDFQELIREAPTTDVWAFFRDGPSIRAVVGEVTALRAVQRGSQELATDPVAAREIRERLQVAQAAERDLLDSLLREPANSQWYWSNQRIEIEDRRSLQHALSRIMDRLFENSPIIRNELINRNRPSTQAVAARNKLFQCMLSAPDQPRLGIKKHPPELAIYRSILEAGGLHIETKDGFRFVEPPPSDPLNLLPTWQRLNTRLAESHAKPISFQSLIDDLGAPPYGVRRGVVPILFLHYYLMHRYEIAIYDEGSYAHSLDYDRLERMLRRPDLFAFQRFRIDGVRASLFDEYSMALFGEVRDSLNVLSLARPLAAFIHGLDSHTQRTLRLSPSALRVRQSILLSKSPDKLLFDELPKACGFEEISDPSGFADILLAALRELKQAHSELIDYMRRAFCGSFVLDQQTSLKEVRAILRGRCHELDRYTVDVEGLRSFIRRLTEHDAGDDKWFASVLLFLGRKPTSKWSDQDRDTAEYRLTEFSRRIADLEELRVQFDRAHATADVVSDFVFVKAVTEATGELHELVTFNASTDAAIGDVLRNLEHALSEIPNEQLRLAAVARFTSNFLNSRRRAQLSETRNHEELKQAQ